MKFDVVDQAGKKVGEIELSDAVFGAELNAHLFYEVGEDPAVNRRRGTVAVKNRSLVSGGGKKPWKQKGTGRARQGSIRASQWVGGGKAMGPKPRDYTYRPPRTVRRGALCARAVAAGQGEAARHPRQASTPAEPKTQGGPPGPDRGAEAERGAGGGRQGQHRAPPQRAQPRALRRPAPGGRQRRSRSCGTRRWSSPSAARQGPGGSAGMNATDVIKGPLITEKLDRAREKLRQYAFVVDREATKHDVQRAVETLFQVHVEAVRTLIIRGKSKRVGRTCRPAPQLEEGHRDAEGRRQDRALRGRRGLTWASRNYKPTSAARRLTTVSDFAEITKDRPEKTLTESMRRSGGRNVHGHITTPAPGRRPQAPLPRHRLQAPGQGRRAGQGGGGRVRPQPLGQPRAAALRRRREALHPRPGGLAGGRRAARPARTPTSVRAMRCRSGTIPVGTVIHNVELKPGRGGQMIRTAGTCGPADGQGGRLRPDPACPRARSARCCSSAGPPSASSATSSTTSSASARRARAAGWASVRRCAVWP